MSSTELEARTRFAFFAAPIPMAILDREFVIRLANPSFVERCGSGRRDLVGCGYFEIFPDEGRRAIFERVRDTGEAFVPPPLAANLRDGEGGDPESPWSLVPSCAPDGRVEELLWTLLVGARDARGAEVAPRTGHDLEESRAALGIRHTERAALYASVLDILFEVVVEPGGGYRFLWVNQAFLASTGLAREQVVGKRLEEVIPEPALSAVLARYGEAVASGQTMSWEEVSSYPAGRKRALVTITPLHGESGAISHLVGVVHDLTDRERAKELERLRELDRRKDDFLAVLSHELRNPLMPIRLGLHVLQRVEPGSDRAQRAMVTIDRQVAHLSRLVDDLLDIARVRRGQIDLRRERVELGSLVRQVIEDQQATFDRRGIQLAARLPAEDLWVRADPTRIAQLLGNLLGNANKFTPAGGRVEVTLEGDGDVAVLSCADTGIGILPEELEVIFEPFTQARAASGKAAGLGLGLSLVKALAELHGGSVAARSEGREHGSQFTVRLPLAQTEAGTGEAQVRPAKAPGLRVLVIEDIADVAESLRDVLELDGHEVALAATGSEGVQAAHEFRPDVVFCDIGLPDMDGYSVARTLRGDETLEGTFLIALTGHALPEDQKRASAAGFARHLAKPPNPEKLAEILAEVALRFSRS
jgi:PAS domain S-box-containing protein